MQNIDDIRKTPTIVLINALNEACEQDNQPVINYIAYELACRIYVPNKGVDFDKLVADFGYKDISKEQTQNKVLSKRK